LYVQEGVYDALVPQLLKAYQQVRAGDPLEEGTLLGPLHTKDSKARFLEGIEKIKAQV
jgi:aldehyde dehydrogenase family 7 protein A1